MHKAQDSPKEECYEIINCGQIMIRKEESMCRLHAHGESTKEARGVPTKLLVIKGGLGGEH